MTHEGLAVEDRYLMSETELQGRLAVLLGGRVAEALAFGEVSTGALDDLRTGLPLDAFPWLEHATPEQQRNYQASPISIYWPDLEDGIDMEYFTGEWVLHQD